MMRAAQICLLSVLLAALYNSGAADDGWKKGGGHGDHHDYGRRGDRDDGDHHHGEERHHDDGDRHGDRRHDDLAGRAGGLSDGGKHHQKKHITIYGKITWKGHGLKGAKVYAYDHTKMGKDVQLGHAYTDKYGRYKIKYSLEKHHKHHKYPNVFISVKYKGKTRKSRVYYNVRDDVKIDLAF